MTHGHAHEEAEHASHHSYSPFDKRVAFTMVVVAALLAAVKVLAHRAHNDTLSYQIKAGVYQSKANTEHTLESDQWNFFQAKKQRQYLYETQAAMLESLTPSAGLGGVGGGKGPTAAEQRLADELRKKDPELSTDEAREAARRVAVVRSKAGAKRKKVSANDASKEKRLREIAREEELETQAAVLATKRYFALAKKAYPEDRTRRIVDWESKSFVYGQEARDIQKDAEKHKAKADKYREEAEEYQKSSAHKHHQADRLDLGELLVELALVVCSVAILSKRPGFWYAGMVLCAAGTAVAATAFLV